MKCLPANWLHCWHYLFKQIIYKCVLFDLAIMHCFSNTYKMRAIPVKKNYFSDNWSDGWARFCITFGTKYLNTNVEKNSKWSCSEFLDWTQRSNNSTRILRATCISATICLRKIMIRLLLDLKSHKGDKSQEECHENKHEHYVENRKWLSLWINFDPLEI